MTRPIDLLCPSCGAEPGAYCNESHRGYALTGHFHHAARVDAAMSDGGEQREWCALTPNYDGVRDFAPPPSRPAVVDAPLIDRIRALYPDCDGTLQHIEDPAVLRAELEAYRRDLENMRKLALEACNIADGVEPRHPDPRGRIDVIRMAVSR